MKRHDWKLADFGHRDGCTWAAEGL